jgi:hypothetical protein
MTLSPADWELLHREVDAETTEKESAELQERLAREPELASSHRALLGLGRTLSQVGLVDPPPELARDVMRQVRQRAIVGTRGGWLSGLSEWVALRPALALASSLAVGLLAGLLVTGLFGRGLLPLDGDSISGTLLPLENLAALPVVDEARLEAPGIRATAVLRRGRGLVVAVLEIASDEPVDITVEVDANSLRPRGFECIGGEAVGGVTIEPGRVDIRQATAGRCVVNLVTLEPNPGPVAVRVETGTARAEATLRARATVE